MKWYCRPDGSWGDSMTDIGALALIGGYDCGAHVRACQRDDGSFFRHPDHPESDFSRDHVISVCNYTLWSKDKDPLKKFVRYSLRNGFKVANGSLTHGYMTPVVLAAILHVLGYRIIGAMLDVVNWPILMLSALFLPAGYQRILLVEHAIIRMNTRSWILPWKTLARYVLKKEPTNLFYKVSCGVAEYIEVINYKDSFDRDRIGGVWHWNNPSDPKRQATGIDLDYIIALMGVK